MPPVIPSSSHSPSNRNPSPHPPSSASSITGSEYLSQLSTFIRIHEQSLSQYYSHRNNNASTSNTSTIPSWTTILSLGILPDQSTPSSSTSSTTTSPREEGDKLVLSFDPHHLYYLLLKFEERGYSTGDRLDVKVVEGARHSKPMLLDYSSVVSAAGGGSIEVRNEGGGGGRGKSPSLFSGIFGGGGNPTKRDNDDSKSIMSSKSSSFSFGSGWWGLGTTSSRGDTTSTQDQEEDEVPKVRYIYSSCTKLPALKLSPFIFNPPSNVTTSSSRSRSRGPPIEAIKAFEDCPPPSTCVPLSIFHSLTSLYLSDLDPRSFLGWERLSWQLKKLEVVRGGLEDLGELVCDCVVEDEERIEKRKEGGEESMSSMGEETVGQNRKKRSGGGGTTSTTSTTTTTNGTNSTTTSFYPTPRSKLAWSSLRHLSLHDNALTFIPTPPLIHLRMLTSLDLSSNLLISIPPALSSLPLLRSLNLQDNMIDNLHSLPTILGNIVVLNLSYNRLENLSGLDRLLALERIDLRGNRIGEALELSRLSRLPRVKEVWVRENPFSSMDKDQQSGGMGMGMGGEENWRIKVLGYFEEEKWIRVEALEEDDELSSNNSRKKSNEEDYLESLSEKVQVKVDGKAIEGRNERRLVELEVMKRCGGTIPNWRTSSRMMMRRRNQTGNRRTASFGNGVSGGGQTVEGGGSNKVVGGGNVVPKKVIVEPRRRVVTAPLQSSSSSSSSPTRQRQTTVPSHHDHHLISTSPPSTSNHLEPNAVAHKRRKPRRIVDLDAPSGVVGSTSSTTPANHGITGSTLSDSDTTTTTTTNTSHSGHEGGGGNHLVTPLEILEGPPRPQAPSTDQTINEMENVSEPPQSKPPSKRHLSRDQRFQSSPTRSRINPASNIGGSSAMATSTSLGHTSSPNKSQNRRERVSTSTYEPSSDNSMLGEGGGGVTNAAAVEGAVGGGGEALRRKIEKLREEVGENWLSVLSEREARQQEQRREQEQQESTGIPVKTNEAVETGSDVAQPTQVERDEGAVEGLAVSAGVKVVKKKGKKKKGK